MIHRFISNDNKGNVNVLEVGSTYTKISKITTPVNDEDAVNKKYVDDHAGSAGGVLIVTESGDILTGYSLDKTWKEIYDAGFAILKDASNNLYVMLACTEDTDNSEYTVSFSNNTEYTIGSPNDYPLHLIDENGAGGIK